MENINKIILALDNIEKNYIDSREIEPSALIQFQSCRSELKILRDYLNKRN